MLGLGRWYAFDTLSHNRIGPFWTRTRAAEVASDMQEELLFQDTSLGRHNERWQAVSKSWLQMTGVL